MLHYLQGPGPTLRELHRVLRDGGTVVVSTSHLANDWQHLGGSYFAADMHQET